MSQVDTDITLNATETLWTSKFQHHRSDSSVCYVGCLNYLTRCVADSGEGAYSSKISQHHKLFKISTLSWAAAH